MKYKVGRYVRAACSVCHGAAPHWTAKNAQAVAYQHAQRTGHEVWVEVDMHIRYNPKEESSNGKA